MNRFVKIIELYEKCRKVLLTTTFTAFFVTLIYFCKYFSFSS